MTFRQVGSVLALALMSGGVSGCGTSPPPPPTIANTKQTRSVEVFNKDLQLIAEYGTGGSALQPIGIAVDSLDPSYPKRAEIVQKKKMLEQAKSDQERKMIAIEIMGLLGAPSSPSNSTASHSKSVSDPPPSSGDFAHAMVMISKLPLSDAEKAEAVRRLLREKPSD